MSSQVNLMALDMGLKRVGVAIANVNTNLPRPLVTLEADDTLPAKLKEIIKKHEVGKVIVGMPRNLVGDNTRQTESVKETAEKLSRELNIVFIYQDEALSSVRAEEDIRVHKSDNRDRGLIDRLAACYILEDYLKK